MLAIIVAMDKTKLIAGDDLVLQLSQQDIVACLDEAEADEAEGRFTDGTALVCDLRRRADELEAKTDRPRV